MIPAFNVSIDSSTLEYRQVETVHIISATR